MARIATTARTFVSGGLCSESARTVRVVLPKRSSMHAIHKILVPTDFSSHSDEAFRVACTLAGAIGAEVVLFHVVRPPAVVAQDGQFLDDPKTGTTANLWDRFKGVMPNDPKVHVTHEVIVS